MPAKLCGEKNTSHLVRPVVSVRQHEAVGLAVHRLGPEGGRGEEDVLPLESGKLPLQWKNPSREEGENQETKINNKTRQIRGSEASDVPRVSRPQTI